MILSSAVFFKINFFEKFFGECHQGESNMESITLKKVGAFFNSKKLHAG